MIKCKMNDIEFIKLAKEAEILLSRAEEIIDAIGQKVELEVAA
jgi:hypothetical protein